MDSNQFSVIIQTVLEKSGITKEMSEVQKIVNNNMVKIVPQLETASIKNNLKEVSKLIANTLNNSLGGDFKISGNDVFKAITASMNEANVAAKKLASEMDRVSAMTKFQNYMSNNTKITKDAKNSLLDWINTIETADDLTRDDLRNINSDFKKLDTSMRSLGKLGYSWTDKFKQTIEKFGGWTLATGSLMTGIQKFKNAITELKEIDTLITEISKANSDLSKTDLANITNDSFDVASKYGKSATDYLSGVQEMSRAGYDAAESMAELSTAAQGAGDMTADLANKYIIATDNAYKLNGNVKALTETLDGSNNITNNNAVNMTELAEGMSVVGSQAASSGIAINETTAALGTMIAATQQSGSEMANAFKGILMNLQQVTGEVDGEIIDEESLTKYEEAADNLGVSLSEVKNGIVTLKEPMQILKELSEEYTKLDKMDAKRANLLSAVGGKYRANALNAILENYSMYEKMLQEYADGTGSMAREAEKTANSWEGSLNRVNNTWTDTVENVANSDAIITMINSFNGLLSVINNVTGSLGSLGTLTTGIGAVLGAKGLGLTIYLSKFYKPIYIRLCNNAI